MSNTAIREQDYEKDVKVDFSIWKRLNLSVMSAHR